MLEPTAHTLGAPARVTATAATDVAPGAAVPFVSIVIPCFNEERFIGEVIERLASQYDEDRFEIVVVDGNSTDNTRAVIADCAARSPHVTVRLVDNPARHIPVALNLGIRAARGEIIARMDAHAVPSVNYLRRCVELLSDEDDMIVGTPCRIRAAAETLTARAVAAVVAHPFGIGDAQYRIAHAGEPRDVDTVPFGVFRKSLWQRVGGFDESLLANEDYDFNYRVRAQGGRVVLDTGAHTIYYARPTLGALARQYFRYGLWKAQMLRQHPRSVRWRHAVAPAFVASLVCAMLVGFAWRPAWWLLIVALAAYLLPALAFAVSLARREGDYKFVAPVVASFFVVHFAWGGGFWRGLLGRARARQQQAATKS
jgi:cellulose synthase/poly-beta-1,6-N-acetylglucosamine synthase-like glycosyltransferase